MKTPVISVIMPAYCCERFIGEAINSVLSQTYQDFELLVIDDCSNDGTADIIREFAQRDLRVVYLHNEQNMGVAKTRNRGIGESRGKYIALLDSDDVWDPRKLERQLALLQECDASIAYCSYGFIDENSKVIKKAFIVPEKTDFQHMLTSSVISCSTALISAELLKAHTFRSDIYHEDYALWMELLAIPVSAAGDKEILAYYRQVSGSRNSEKLHAAAERWRIFRVNLNLGLLKSIWYFAGYAINGVMKYWL